MAGPDEPRPTPRTALRPAVAAAALIVAGVSLAIGVVATSRGPASSAPPVTAAPSAQPPAPRPTEAATAPDPTGLASPPSLTGAPPRVGSIAVVDAAGGLSVLTPDGRATALTRAGDTTAGFPAFSPDGRRLAAIVIHDGVAAIEAFPTDPVTGVTGPRVTLYRSASQGAFYVAWTPGGEAVSFLANDGDTVVLRVVGADRSTPLDETDTASLIRRGAPLYFDWVGDDRLVAHVGTGEGAFLGEVLRDGTADGGTLPRPGDFRAAQVTADGRFVGYLRATTDGGEVVARARDVGTEVTMPLFGPGALLVAPGGDVYAAIGADRPGQPDLAFPVGPLRTLDATSGEQRTLLAGLVVAAFWSPDGGSLFAIRLQPPSGSTAAAGSPSAAPSEVHGVIVDAGSGAVRVDQVVRPGQRFVSEVLPYFDQYALSHRFWAPDSSSFLLPIDTATGPSVVAIPRDGGPSPFSIDAAAAFWSP